ncbi:MAG TPA: Hsp20/alpha crystallin family protein [Rhodopila sp.]|nr:Hsp20/alpha crystallin family protein [Rhodopila sp.]
MDVAGLGGIADVIGNLRGLIEQLSGTGKASEAKDASGGAYTLGGQNARVVFGYTLRMGPDGVQAERFGDVPGASADARPAAPQPITEVYTDGDVIVVIAELPGADPNQVLCEPKGSTLLIETTGARRYRKELVLPAPVVATGMVRSMRNGVLEVRLNLEKAS